MGCTAISSWRCGQCAEAPEFVFDLQLFAGEKTEEPTGKRISEAERRGQFAKSQELVTAFVLFGGFWALYAFGQSIYSNVTAFMAYTFSNMATVVIDSESVMQLFLNIVTILARTSFPIMVSVMVMGLVTNMWQVGGFKFTTEPLGFNLGKLNPIAGFSKIFSKGKIVELFKCLFKLAIIGLFLHSYINGEIFQMPKMLHLELVASLPHIADVIFRMAFQICGVFFIMAILDYAYQKWEYKQGLKMTKQEVKDEFKQTEGNPEIKSKIKQKQREMAMARMMKEVPTADVVVTNPTHFAVALKYEKGMEAPRVVAKGQDLVALKIKTVARENGVEIVEDKPLARALFALVEIGQSVPPELYKAVAEVLAYVYRLKHRRPA